MVRGRRGEEEGIEGEGKERGGRGGEGEGRERGGDLSGNVFCNMTLFISHYLNHIH
jgi:hypothetical protein